MIQNFKMMTGWGLGRVSIRNLKNRDLTFDSVGRNRRFRLSNFTMDKIFQLSKRDGIDSHLTGRKGPSDAKSRWLTCPWHNEQRRGWAPVLTFSPTNITRSIRRRATGRRWWLSRERKRNEQGRKGTRHEGIKEGRNRRRRKKDAVCCGQCQWPCFLRPTFYAGTTSENTRAHT